MAGQFLADIGIFSPVITDNLYAYARMMHGIRDAVIHLPMPDENGDIKEKFVKYVLVPKSWFLYKLLKRLESSRRGIISKIGLILLSKLGAPVFVEQTLEALTRSIMLGKYDVRFEYAKELPTYSGTGEPS